MKIPRVNTLKKKIDSLTKERDEFALQMKTLQNLYNEKITVLNSLSELVIYHDMNMRMLWVNDAAARSVSMKPGKLIGECCYYVWHKRKIPCKGCPIVKVRKTGKPHSSEVKTSDGRIWLIKGYPVRDDKNKMRGVIEITLDITERKKAEEALAFERAQLLSIFDSINEVIYVTDPYTDEILYINKYLKGLLGRDALGKKCYKEFQGLSKPCSFCTNKIILKNKFKPYQWEYYNPNLKKHYMISDRIIKWPDGRDVRFELAIDITELKRLQQMKNNLLRDVSHSLKTPIAMTQMALNICESAMKDKKMHLVKKSHNIAANNIARLGKDIENILELSRLDIHGIKKRARIVNIKPIIDSIISDVEPMRIEKNLILKLNISNKANMVKMDKKDFQLLLGNIIDNAVKFTDSGYVDIRAEKMAKYIKIKVKDTGRGILRGEQKKIFERFHKNHVATYGAGLGLTICKEILDKYGGKIDVVSKGLRQGTTVIIQIPCR